MIGALALSRCGAAGHRWAACSKDCFLTMALPRRVTAVSPVQFSGHPPNNTRPPASCCTLALVLDCRAVTRRLCCRAVTAALALSRCRAVKWSYSTTAPSSAVGTSCGAVHLLRWSRAVPSVKPLTELLAEVNEPGGGGGGLVWAGQGDPPPSCSFAAFWFQVSGFGFWVLGATWNLTRFCKPFTEK